jgi:glycosyltransferase involved in cell wall biosynthesis
MIRFTVLMCVWSGDQPAFLERAIQSVTAEQTLPPERVVVVIDGPVSADVESVILRQANAHPHMFDILRLKKNGGLGAALRAGMTRCKTEWIARMDSDDVSEPYRFEEQVAYLESNPGIDVLGGMIAEFDCDEHVITGVREVPLSQARIERMLPDRNPMNHVTVFMRKDAVERAGGYLAMPQTEDYYLWARMLEAGCRLENMNRTLVRVRCGNGFLQRRSNKALIEGYAGIERYLRDVGRITTAHMARNIVLHRLLTIVSPSARAALYRALFRKRAPESAA